MLTLGIPGKVNIGKQINVLGGRIETNSINPLGGFDVNVGPEGSLTSSKMSALGFTSKTFGSFEVDAEVQIAMNSLGPISLSTTLGSVTLENALGTIEIESFGKIAIENKIGTLGTILDELMKALLNLNVPTGVGPSGFPINTPALTAVQTKLKALLA